MYALSHLAELSNRNPFRLWNGGRKMTVCFGSALLAFASFISLDVTAGTSFLWTAERKKVVSFAWEWRFLTPDDLVRSAKKINDTGLDGIGIYISPKGHVGEWNWMSRWLSEARFEWTHEMVEDQIPALKKATEHKGLRECFIMSLAAPRKRIDWKDDARWHRIAKSMGTMAWLAKQGGVRGLAIDPEDYGRVNQYKRCPGDEPWEVLAPLARKRGREIFSEVFREYPDITICSFWLLSWDIGFVDANNPILAARSEGNLWPAFVNGMLDVMPPTALVVDGNEWAYHYKAANGDFAASSVAQRNAVFGLIAPENRRKYRGQVLPGFGLYLDSYTGEKINEKGEENKLYFGPENGSRLAHLQRNFSSAVRNCGGYVWFWGEKYTWIDHCDGQKLLPDVTRKRWEDMLPGLSMVVRACSDPAAFLENDFPALRGKGLMKDLMAGRDARKLSAEAPMKPYGEKHFACRFPGTDVRPGMLLVFEVEGTGDRLSVGYWWSGGRLPNGCLALDRLPDGRRRGIGVVPVPEGATGLNIDFLMFPETETGCSYDKIYLGVVPTSGTSK